MTFNTRKENSKTQLASRTVTATSLMVKAMNQHKMSVTNINQHALNAHFCILEHKTANRGPSQALLFRVADMKKMRASEGQHGSLPVTDRKGK